MSADGGNHTLPDGWRRVRLGDVLELRNGRAFKPGEWKASGRPIIRIQNLKSDGATFNYFDGDLPDRFAARHGDLLFAWSGTPGTSFGAHVWEGPDAWINQHIFRVDFSSDLFDRDFLKSALNMNLSSYIEQAQGGVGLAHITKAKLNESELLAPPIAEQRRIVERLDKVEERRSAIAAHLEAARVTLERVRSSVLSAASSGRLTEDWRESRGLPDWQLMPAQEVCDKVQSGTTPKRWHTGHDGVPFLKVYNIVDQQLSFAPPCAERRPLCRSGAMYCGRGSAWRRPDEHRGPSVGKGRRRDGRVSRVEYQPSADAVPSERAGDERLALHLSLQRHERP